MSFALRYAKRIGLTIILCCLDLINCIVAVDEVVDIFVDSGMVNLLVALSSLRHGFHVLYIGHVFNTNIKGVPKDYLWLSFHC